MYSSRLFRKQCACIFYFCIGWAAYAQQNRDLVSCKPIADKKGESGCWILTSHSIGALEADAYWTIDVFPTRELAEQAKEANGTIVESLGKVWLLTVGNRPESSAGTRVAQIGPMKVEKGRSYTAQYMEATLLPGMVSKTHLHSGIEAFYTETGETCLETPNGTQTGTRGHAVIVPEGVPMELTAIGSEVRRGLILILHDASKPPTTLVETWKSKHLCNAANVPIEQ